MYLGTYHRHSKQINVMLYYYISSRRSLATYRYLCRYVPMQVFMKSAGLYLIGFFSRVFFLS